MNMASRTSARLPPLTLSWPFVPVLPDTKDTRPQKSPFNSAKSAIQYFQFDVQRLASYDSRRSVDEGMYTNSRLCLSLPKKENFFLASPDCYRSYAGDARSWRLRNAPPSAPNRFGISRMQRRSPHDQR